MKTIITKTDVYKFAELSDDAKQKAIENFYDLSFNYDWWDCTYEDANMVGITITEFDLNRNRRAETTINDCQETAELILENHGEICETYKTAKSFLDEYLPLKAKYEKADSIDYKYGSSHGIGNTVNRLQGELEDLQDNFKQSITEDYSIMLQREYEYQTSEETIIESIEANDCDFTIDGKLV